MLQVTKITVRSFNLDHMDVFWEIAPVAGPSSDETPHEIFDYDFYVLRSEAAMGPFDQIGGPYRDTYSFRDVGVQTLHKWRQFFYKLRIVHRQSGEEVVFGPASSLEPEPDLIAGEIIRQEDMLFREFTGRKCLLYPARTFGPACTCFDVYSGRRTRSQHKPCFGTGWLGGFLSPVLIFVQIDPFPKASEQTSLQERQPGDTTGRMISFPPVNPKDILIEAENKRWRVEKNVPTQRLRAVVRQELTLHEIPKGDIEYGLPVNLDIQSLQPSAERNFTNPQNIDAKEKDRYDDILAAYGHPRGALR